MMPGLHQQHVMRRFSASAVSYEDHSQVQAEVIRQVMARVPASVHPQRVLDVGCGTGRLLALARARWPEARLTGVDIAPGMIDVARARLAGDDRIELIAADILDYHGVPFDLVLSSSSLHWFRPLDGALPHLLSLVAPRGYLVAGFMTGSSLRELRAARQAVAPHKPTAGRLPSLEEVGAMVGRVPGIRMLHLEEQVGLSRYHDAQGLLHRLHDMGVTGGDLSRGDRPLNRRELRELADYYDQHFPSPDGGVMATFGIGYLVVERP